MFDIKNFLTEHKTVLAEAPKKMAPSAVAGKLYSVNERLQTQKYNLNEAKKTLAHLASVDPDFKSLTTRALQDHEKASRSLQTVGKLLEKKLTEFHGPGNEWRWD